MAAFEVLLFGDETGDSREPLQKLCERRKGVVFVNFIDKLRGVLREEIRQQPRHVQQQIPPFTDLLDLVKQYRESGSRNPILETTLTCICQLASVMSFFDDHPSEYFVPSDTVLVGLCTGLLASAAVSASKSLVDLIPIALNIVRVAFRIGVKVNSAAQRLATVHEIKGNQSWSRLVVGIQKEAVIEEVNQFNERKGLPRASQAYVSSHSRDVATVSGPPTTLKALFAESESFRTRKSVALDIFGPFHASHLYNDDDIEEVLQPITEEGVKQARPLIRVISGNANPSLPDVNIKQFLTEIVQDILFRPLAFDGVLDAVTAEARNSGKEGCRVSAAGPSNAVSSLVSALKAATEVEASVGEQLGATGHATDSPGTSVKIAVVGMAGRFPNADSLETLWSLLEQGLDVHRRIPADRFDVDTHYDPTGKKKNTSHTPYGCFIDEPGLFDPRFFNMSPREAYQTDPMGRLALVTAYEALEMSGFVPNRTPSSMTNRIGTFYGQTSDDWRQVNAAQKIDTYYIPGTIRAFAGGRINYYFKFSGPSYNVDTACSSSFSAIQLACTSLQAKECDTAIAGGLNVMTAPDLFAGLSRAQFLSKTGSCKTFDDSADGFCRGDGVGTVVLKRLEDAEADNDLILGVILGTATNHSSEAVSITQPHAPTQEGLYKKILTNTGVDFRDVSYVEMHGTGTQAGDGAEMRSITNVFAPPKGRRPDQTLHLGAVKANIGHGEASAGVSSLIKVLLMMQRNAIPPHVGIKGTMNHTFPPDLDERGVRIALKETPWVAPDGEKRRAYLNNFSAAGGNTGLLLEDAPKSKLVADADPRTSFVVSVSAKSAFSLEKNIQNLASYLEANPDTALSRLSYTTTARRVHHPYRVSVAASTISEVKDALMAYREAIKPVASESPKVCFVFTGQGSHYPSLGKQLFENSKQFRTDILDFDKIGRSQGFPSILPLIDGSVTELESLSAVVLQLGQSCVQMALARLWISWGISPSAVLGHSLGQYASLNVAGVLSVSDTIYLVGRRAELLQEHCTAGTHAMLAVATSVAGTQEILAGETLEVACINGPKETVISGLAEQVISYSKTLKAAGIKCVVLPTAYAFHSSQVDTILDALKKTANSITFRDAAIPVISPLLKKVVTSADIFGPEFLARHARETVNFLAAIEAAKSDGVIDKSTVWVEIGPSPVCSAFVKSSLGNDAVTVPTLRKKEDAWKTLSGGLAVLHRNGVNVDWSEVHREYESSHVVLALPRYTFENKNFWLDYTNDWCLHKGDVVAAPAKKSKDYLSTASVQKLVKEDFGNKITVVAESDVTHPELNNAIHGHLVNGSALCPSAVYADMALTLAGYVHRKVNKGAEPIGMDARHLEIIKPLIAKGRDSKEPQLVRITATAEKPLKSVKISYNSVSRDGKLGELHATCTVEYGDTKTWIENWSRLAYLFRSRIDVLIQGGAIGKFTKLTRGPIYDAFSALVHYDKKYHGMKEVIFNGKTFEATSLIEFQATERDGDFETSPYWIDNVAHLSGFVLNGNDAVDSAKTVYISHGWESLQVAQPLSANKSYRNYVKMHSGSKQTMVGDVYVFEGDNMIALVAGVKFQAIPRVVLNKLLPPINGFGYKPKAKTTSSHSKVAIKAEVKKQPVAVPSQPTYSFTAPTPSAQGGSSSIVSEFISIIAEELGLETSELSNSATFANIGLDSLMSLTVTGRMREELDMDVPTSLFIDYPTIGEAKVALIALKGGDASTQIEVTATTSTHTFERETPSIAVITATASVSGSETLENITGITTPNVSFEDATESILAIIAEELGIEQSELAERASFSDMGLDSLMSLTITGRVREELDIDIPTSFFTDYPTISEAKAAVSALMGGSSHAGNAMPYTEDAKPYTQSPISTAYTGHTTPSEEATLWSSLGVLDEAQLSEKALPSATSILLQGNPKTASKFLFLFPDGSGSATSYALFPAISPDVCVYGLNCPYMKSPEDYTNGIDGVAAQYITEIKRRQGSGPYYFGGWSAGGVLAYQAAYKLIQAGEKVEQLILVDSPCPIGLEPLPSSLLHFVDSTGLLGSQHAAAPEWLIPHFEASIRNLSAFTPVPMNPHDAPKTVAIWARDGFCENSEVHKYPRSADEPKSVRFLLDSRRDYGAFGWDKLVGAENIDVKFVEGNHFTIIRDPEVSLNH
ncbi:putative polyketide synthase [Xylogone sp. PMI_703]|nr:putative polyketide synthase [Xylogone sp. PMI_703]